MAAALLMRSETMGPFWQAVQRRPLIHIKRPGGAPSALTALSDASAPIAPAARYESGGMI